MNELLSVETRGQGLYEITSRIKKIIEQSGKDSGLCTVFVRHTSASLTIQENADPSARHDLEQWIQRMVPENDPHFTHTFEGADDMPSHIKAALTDVSLSIPIMEGSLCLGTWQGIYLWEHRDAPQKRSIVVSLT